MSTPSWPAHPAGPDPELLAPLVTACPTVAGLHGGRFGEVATYLPGRRVRGIRVTATGVEIHVVGRYPVRAAEIAAQVRAAVQPAVTSGAGPLPVHVTIEDLVLPGEPDPGEPIEHDAIRPGPGPAAGATQQAGPRTGAPAFPPPPSTTSDARDTAAVAPRPPALGLDRTQESSR